MPIAKPTLHTFVRWLDVTRHRAYLVAALGYEHYGT